MEVAGPCSREPALLLIAGGARFMDGCPHWPGVRRNRILHIVWCVKTRGDYLALSRKASVQRGACHSFHYWIDANGDRRTLDGASEIILVFKMMFPSKKIISDLLVRSFRIRQHSLLWLLAVGFGQSKAGVFCGSRFAYLIHVSWASTSYHSCQFQ